MSQLGISRCIVRYITMAIIHGAESGSAVQGCWHDHLWFYLTSFVKKKSLTLLILWNGRKVQSKIFCLQLSFFLRSLRRLNVTSQWVSCELKFFPGLLCESFLIRTIWQLIRKYEKWWQKQNSTDNIEEKAHYIAMPREWSCLQHSQWRCELTTPTHSGLTMNISPVRLIVRS